MAADTWDELRVLLVGGVGHCARLQLKAKISSATSAVKSMFGQGDGVGDKAVEWRARGQCVWALRAFPCMFGSASV